MKKEIVYTCESCGFKTTNYDEMLEHEKTNCIVYYFTATFGHAPNPVVIKCDKRRAKSVTKRDLEHGLFLLGGSFCHGVYVLAMYVDEKDPEKAANKFVDAVGKYFKKTTKQFNTCIDAHNEKHKTTIKRLEVPINELSSRS